MNQDDKQLNIWEWRVLSQKAQNDVLNQLNGVEALQLIKTIKEYENENM